MNTITTKLIEYFEKLPGIGPRQAGRFVFFLLKQESEFLKNFGLMISNLKTSVIPCASCQRFFENDNENNNCSICRNPNRDKDILLVVEKDIDLESMEKAGFYNGQYFVLGGIIPLLIKELPQEIKMKQLHDKVKKEMENNSLVEIILAFSATTEGDNTARYTEKILEPIAQKHSIKITRLGRGLSTGTELEYSDKETIVNALKTRR
ncbi:MAG: toprim domain-containing protein [bacterium]|nr:toprim domain-containing protein [bacterium]